MTETVIVSPEELDDMRPYVVQFREVDYYYYTGGVASERWRDAERFESEKEAVARAVCLNSSDTASHRVIHRRGEKND